MFHIGDNVSDMKQPGITEDFMAAVRKDPGVSEIDHNPYLKPWLEARPNPEPGKGEIEVPGEIVNLVWQTRPAPPTEYENVLGDALEAVFQSGAVELPDVVAGLNGLGVRAPDGKPWTAETFDAEMARLGA
jgi:hypothetical protein